MNIIKRQNMIWGAVRFRPWFAAGIFVVSQLVALACWFRLPHHYKAEAVVLLDITPNPAQTVSSDLKANAVAAKIGLLTSRLLAERVIERLGLASSEFMRETWASMGSNRPPFDEWLGALVSGGVVPSGSKGSYLLKIGYASPSEEFSAGMANAFADELVALSDLLNRGFDRYADRTFEIAEKRTREEMIAAQKKLSGGAHKEVMLEGLSDPAMRAFLMSSVQTNRSVRAYLEGGATNEIVGGLKDAGSLLDDSYLQGQNAKLADLKAQRAEAATSMGDVHPVVKALDSSIRSIENGMKVYESKRRASMGASARVQAQVADELTQSQAGMKAALLDRERAYKAYESNMREVDAAGERYEDSVTQYALMSLNRDVPRSDVRLVSRATKPDEHWFPIWYYYFPVSIALGLLYMILASYIMERRDRRIRSRDDLVAVVGVDLVNTIQGMRPEIKRTGRSPASAKSGRHVFWSRRPRS